jgi:hypothetical protein
VAPVIHDFTYEPLVYDLLPMEGNVFSYEATTNAGEAGMLDCLARALLPPDSAVHIAHLVALPIHSNAGVC